MKLVTPSPTDTAEDFCENFSALRAKEGYEEYGRFQQHLVLLEDEIRLSRFHQAINAAAPGNVFVDVGTGTGVLSLLAIKENFSKGYAVEPSRKIARYAQYLFKKNGVEEIVDILHSPLENLQEKELPDKIDLIITETISSVIFGFGCWDRFGELLTRLSPQGTMVPCRGRLMAFLAERDYASRSDENTGLRYLTSIGLEVDLYQRTFRSGGNIYNKGIVNFEIASGLHELIEIASFDIRKRPFMQLAGEMVSSKVEAVYKGIIFFWEIILSETKPWIVLDSRDPGLTSWNPYYIPFKTAFEVRQNQVLNIRLNLVPNDAPYTYCFEVKDGDRPLTNTLYW